MKHFSKLLVATPIVALGGGILVNSAVFTAPSASAASHTLTQSSFTDAIAGTATDGVICDTADQHCTLEAGDYTLGGNINLTAAAMAGKDYGLYFNTGNTTFDLGGKTLTMSGGTFLGGDFPNKTVAIKNGTIAGGELVPLHGNFTLSSLNYTGAISPTDSTINILSGTYSRSGFGSVIEQMEDSTFNISGGTFTAEEPVMIIYNMGDATTKNTLNISGGTFTSTLGAAVDFANEEGFAEGPVTVNISGGTFTGVNNGLFVIDSSLNNITLTGGTFTATGTGETAGAIVSCDGLPASIRGFLGAGYEYTNSNIATKTTSFDSTIAYIDGTTSVRLISSDDEDDEKGATTDETSSETSSESSESTESVGTPDSGRVTSEGGSATASALATVGAATAITSAAYLAKKHFAKKNA